MIKLTDSLIVKYLSKEANLFEKEELNYLISKKKNHKLFKNFTYTNYLSLMSFNNHDLDKGKRNIYNRIRLIEKRNKLERYKKYAFAASVIFLIGISLFNQFNFNYFLLFLIPCLHSVPRPNIFQLFHYPNQHQLF